MIIANAILVIMLQGPTCEPHIRDIPATAEAYCIAGDRAPTTSPRPRARPDGLGVE